MPWRRAASYAAQFGRGQRDALDALVVSIEHPAVNCILDADVKEFFDNISHEWMIRFVEHVSATSACCG